MGLVGVIGGSEYALSLADDDLGFALSFVLSVVNSFFKSDTSMAAVTFMRELEYGMVWYGMVWYGMV